MGRGRNLPTMDKNISQGHRNVWDALVDAGHNVEVEVPFGRFRVDCYLPEFHVAVEIDGSGHNLARDIQRDAELMEFYSLPVCRVKHSLVKSKAGARSFLGELDFFLAEDVCNNPEARKRVAMANGWGT